MKRVLVLYMGLAGSRHEHVAANRWKLRLAGARLSVADYVVDPRDEAAFEHVIELPPPERLTEAWAVLRETLDRHHFDGIVAQSEHALLIGSLAARHLGVPGPSVEGAFASTNKWLSRRLARAAGVPQPEFALVSSGESVRAFARQHGWPVILKAVASSRQRLVTKVERETEVDAAVARLKAGLPLSKDVRRLVEFCKLEGLDPECDPLHDFLVESFADGEPVECDGIVVGSEARSMGVCDQIHVERPAFFIDGYLVPSDRPAAVCEELERQTRKAVHALGLRDTGYSVEYRLCSDGPRLIEVNGRLGWDEGLAELYAAACGQQPAVMVFKLALGKRLGRIKPRRRVAVAFHSCFDAAVVERLPSKEQLRALQKQKLSVGIHTDLGARILAAENPDSRPHLAHVLATDRRSSRKAFERARAAASQLSFELRPGLASAQDPDLALSSISLIGRC